LRLSAEDGSELILNADTNSNDTLSLEVFSDGIRTDRILPWSEQTSGFHLTPNAVEQFYAAGLSEIPGPEDCAVN